MIIYLHGFNSSGASAKGQFLRTQLEDIPVLTPSYHHDPGRAIVMLQHLIEQSLRRDQNLLLAGSSLGGYYTQYLGQRYSLKRVMINPALMPLTTLEDLLGENVNYHTGERYILTTRHLEALRSLDIPHPCNDHPPPSLVLLDKGDELLDYRLAAERYQPCADVRLFDDGDHAFQHLPESLIAIRALHETPWPGSIADGK